MKPPTSLEFIEIKISDLDLLTQEGYFARYRENISVCLSRRIAWEETEKELQRAFHGRFRKFVDFDSFKTALGRERKRHKLRSRRVQRVTLSILK